MPPTSAAMELKVLINILSSGTALQSLVAQTNQLSQALTKLQAQAGSAGGNIIPPGLGIPPAAKAAEESLINLEGAFNKVVRAIRLVTGGFLAYQSVRFIKDIADTAARAEVLQTTLHVVALNAGVTSDEIDKLDKSVQRMGITASSSRQSLVQMLQARLDVKWAPQLARAAQDLAVVSGMNSSATFQRLILNIQQIDALGLRWMGVMVSREQAEKRYAEAQHTTVRALSRRQQVEAFMIETLEQLKTLEGAYVAAMGDVGKQLLSLERLTTTLKETLGEALLPVYSALVDELGHFYEQLIVVAQVTTANKEGAKTLGEIVRGWAISIREFSITAVKWLSDNIELVKNLVKWGIELKLTIMGIRALVWISSSAIAFITFLTNTIRAIAAFRAGMVGFSAIMDIMKAKTVQAGIAQLELATAQRAAAATAATAAQAQAALALQQAQAAVSAGTATMAQRGLAASVTGTSTAIALVRTAWLGLAALVAVPIIGYIYVRYKEAQEESKKPIMERLMGVSKMEDFSGLAQWSGEAKRQINAQREFLFHEWLYQHEELVKAIEKEQGKTIIPALVKLEEKGPLQKMFLAEEATYKADTTQQSLLDRLIQKKAEIDQAATLEESTRGTAANESAKRLLERKNAELEFIQAQFVSIHGTNEAAAAEVKLFEAQSKKWAAQREVSRTLEEPTTKENSIKATDALAEAVKNEKNAWSDLEAAIRSNVKLDPYQRQQQVETAARNRQRREDQEFGDRVREAKKQLGLDKFTFPLGGTDDTELAAFTQGAKNFELVLEERTKSLALKTQAGAEQARQSGKTLKEALKVVSESVTDASSAEFRELVNKYIASTGDVATATTALGRAAQNARQARLAFAAPVIAEQREITTDATNKRIAQAQRTVNSLNTQGQVQGNALENLQRQNLIRLDDYYRQRMDRIREQGEAEINLQEEQINQALELQTLAIKSRDPKQIRDAEAAVAREREQARVITGKTEAELDRERLDRDERRRVMNKEIEAGLIAQSAQFGGQKEALIQLNYQLDEEYDKLWILGNPLADQLIKMKRLSGEAEIVRKERERAHQIELGIQTAIQGQLDLRQQMRSAEGASDRLLNQRGRITDVELTRRNNERVREEMADNRQRRLSQEEQLASNIVDFKRQEGELVILRVQQGYDAVEINQQLLVLEQQHAAAILQSKLELEGLNTEYVNLGTQIELQSTRIRKSIEDGFTDAITRTIVDFRKAGEIWKQMANQIVNEIVSIFVRSFVQRGIINMLAAFGGSGGTVGSLGRGFVPGRAEGGVISGPGTGTSDSVPAMLSTGEHVMPASKTAQWLPLLEGIRLGKILPSYALGGVVALQSISLPSVIPRRYANGGVVVSDGGASAVTPGGGGPSNMVVSLHPDAMNMTLREWLEHEVVRQQGRR